jgi:hypothetical protein
MEQQELEQRNAAAQPPASANAEAARPRQGKWRRLREALEAQPQARRRASLLLPSPQPAERVEQCVGQFRSLGLGGQRRQPARHAAAAAAEAAAKAAAKAAAVTAAAKAATAAAKAAANAAAVAAEPRAERLPRAVRPAGYSPLVRGAQQLERERRKVNW